MDKKRLLNLISLANNNPNEDEANSAARKVCSLLATYSFPDEVSKDFNYIRWCQRHRKLKSVCGCK